MKRETEKLLRSWKNRARRRRVVTAMACVVALGTVAALMHPAMTLENAACTRPEHQHTQTCYTQVTTEEKQIPVCTAETGKLHVHEETCYDGEGVLCCGEADFVLHRHDAACYDGNGALWCPLPEIEAHCHSQACFPEGEIQAACGKPEIIPHQHTAACSDENGVRICGLPQVLSHQHGGECFETVEEPVDPTALTCTTQDASHVHDWDCYGTWVLDCDLTEHLHSVECGVTEESPEPTLPALEEDGAFLSTLRVEPLREAGADSAGALRVPTGDAVGYLLSLTAESNPDTAYCQGRVRLELVLPLPGEEACFALDAMPWLLGGGSDVPAVTQEVRVIDGTEMPCQVLSGYIEITAPEGEAAAIPGCFSGEIVIRLSGGKPGSTAALQVSAAMEHNTWAGVCPVHQVEERLTVTAEPFTVTCTAEEMQAVYGQFLAEIQALEAAGTEAAGEGGSDLLERLRDAYRQGRLTGEAYEELYDRTFVLTCGDPETIAEPAMGTNRIDLKNSGWFEAYSDSAAGGSTASAYAAVRQAAPAAALQQERETNPSDVQINNPGGSQTNEDGSVSVSKTIAGTALENVFDITLQVQTTQKISEIIREPDMAVVIVLDISNTMNDNFGGVTRYAAAMNAAEGFLDQLAANNALGVSRVGFVAFNTNAHQIFGFQNCTNQTEADALKNIMRTKTGDIINAEGYAQSHDRFTNIEAGLAMASDMLDGTQNQNKFMILLSDGFPTTYISSGYTGYDPYDAAGSRFYDHVLQKPCTYGTSYSDQAAIRARSKAAAIKKAGIKIFSVGVDIGGQTIQEYVQTSEKANGFSVVDRTGTTYEIGDANTPEAYKNWLKTSIGSGYYYDSTDSAGLNDAFSQILEQIRQTVMEETLADWVTSDPMPTGSGAAGYVEWIGFFDSAGTLTGDPLTGTHTQNGENTAEFLWTEQKINWDLKQSGYRETTDAGGITTYTYRLIYRVRLRNEAQDFEEGAVYPTNDPTTLRYRVMESVDGVTAISDPRFLDFPIPSVEGYLAELRFTKQDTAGDPLAGAEFTLRHDEVNCGFCRGDGGSRVTVPDMTATSGEDGTVSFVEIPSGHKYTLEETKVPAGYGTSGDSYRVQVAYGAVTVAVTAADGTEKTWEHTITNEAYYELPNTGGSGRVPYVVGGSVLLLPAAFLLLYRWGRRKKVGIS